MNKKHQEVQVWLEKLFGDLTVPAYELNQYTVGTLHALMTRNEQKERDTQLLIDDLRQKAQEYNAEGQRIEKILQATSLSSASLSQSGLMSLRTLANLALTLQVKDASDTSFLLALQQLDDEIWRVGEARRAEQRTINSLLRKTKAAVLKHSALKKALADLESQAAQEQPDIEKRARETKFLQTKSKEYKSQLQQLQGRLEKVGIDPSEYHQALVKRSEELKSLQDEMVPMKQKLQSYHGLPPDAIQAHMRLDEMRDKVAALEEDLRKKIDVAML